MYHIEPEYTGMGGSMCAVLYRFLYNLWVVSYFGETDYLKN